LGVLSFIPERLRTKVCSMLETAADGLTSLHNPTLVGGIVATSLAQWAINGWLIHLSLASFGIHVSLWVSCIVLGVVAFGVTIPSSPGYFGVIQLCFMSVLTATGVKDERVRVLSTCPVCPGDADGAGVLLKDGPECLRNREPGGRC
jgi:glycosyltransferase 2 family protein